MLVANYTPEHLQAAESLQPRTLEVLELNLEDAFIEYTRGPRKSLPPLLGQGKFSSGKSTAGATT